MTAEPLTGEVEHVTESFGQFGTPRIDAPAPITATFGWYGVEVRVNPYASELDLIAFMGDAAELDEDDVRVIPALTRLLRAYVHPDDWPKFWQASRQNHTQTGDFLALVEGITERVTARPTVQPADSSAGQSTTGRSSTGGSSSPEVQRSLEALAGRPDLAGFILQANPEAFPDAITG